MNQFHSDVLRGLQSNPKFLQSKYFYDKQGDILFQKIMTLPEYYLTNCEMEIFSQQKKNIATAVLQSADKINMVGFGPGDATKSIHLLEELCAREGLNAFVPIDISSNIIEYLQSSLPQKIKGLPVIGFAGDYLEMLPATQSVSSHNRLISFLGSNIGNFQADEVDGFLGKLRSLLSPGDMVLIGFDLKKNPHTIRNAYDDAQGVTAQFNLNLLHRINKELNGTFDTAAFQHYCTYNPESGDCKSFLFSREKQTVQIGSASIHFDENETIHMETSRKYSVPQIDALAAKFDFEAVAHFYDSKKWFVDVLWKV